MNEYKNVMLLSPNKLKGFGVMNINVDDSMLSNCIRIAQNIHLVDIIGQDLVSRLQELVYGKITGSGETIEDLPQYKDLLDEYVLPVLAYRTAVEMAIINNLKIRNMGSVKNSDINVNQTSSDEYKYLSNYYNTYFYDAVNKMVAFLCENKNAFPESKIDCTCSTRPLYANTNLWLGK